jgi:ATP-dependent Lon protease
VSTLPLFPLDIVLFPGGDLPLHVFEPRYRKMIDHCVRESAPFGVLHTRNGELAVVGCEATVLKILRRYPDGRFDILSRGTERFRLESAREHPDGYLQGEVVPVLEDPEETDHLLEDHLADAYRRFASLVGDTTLEPPPRGPRWSFRLAERLRLSANVRQELLELESENQRLREIERQLQVLLPALLDRERGQALVRGNGRLHKPAKTLEGPASQGEGA